MSSTSSKTDVMREIMDSVTDFLKKMPEPVAAKFQDGLKQLRDLSVDARTPRLALVGRRGAGKSSLINAIFREYVAQTGEVTATTGTGRWFDVKGSFGELRLLDTRGLSEGSRPELASTQNAIDDIAEACKEEYPDAILFLVKAKEVDAHIHDDIHEVIAVRDRIAKLHSYSPPIVGVLAQVDELDPVDISSPPYSDVSKTANIAKAEETLRTHLSSHGINTKVFSTSAYSRFEGGQLVSARHWQIEELLTYLAEQLPNDTQIALARVGRIKTVQTRLAKMIVQMAMATSGAIAATPLPVADMPLLTSTQIAMVTGIGYVSGRKMDKTAAAEFLSAMGLNVGAGLVLREVARAMVKLIPFAGMAISSTIAASATYWMGQAAIAYFIEGQPVGKAKELLQQVGDHVPVTQRVAEQVAAAKDKVVETVSTASGKVMDSVGPVAGKVMESVTTAGGKVMESVTTAGGKVLETVGSTAGQVINTGVNADKKLMEQAATGGSQVMQTVAETAGKVMDDVAEGTAKVVDQVSNTGSKMADTAANAADKNKDQIIAGKDKVMDQVSTTTGKDRTMNQFGNDRTQSGNHTTTNEHRTNGDTFHR